MSDHLLMLSRLIPVLEIIPVSRMGSLSSGDCPRTQSPLFLGLMPKPPAEDLNSRWVQTLNEQHGPGHCPGLPSLGMRALRRWYVWTGCQNPHVVFPSWVLVTRQNTSLLFSSRSVKVRPDNGPLPCSTGSPPTPGSKKQPSYLPTRATTHAFYQDKY